MNIIHRTNAVFKHSLIQLDKFYKEHGEPPQRYREHSHEYMQIWYIFQGTCTHNVENLKYQMPIKSLLVIPPYVTHSFSNESDDIIIIGCEFPIEILTEDTILQKSNGNLLEFTYKEVFETAVLQVKPCYVPSPKCQIQIESILENMFNEYQEKMDYYQILLKSGLLSFLACLARDYAISANNSKAEKDYNSYINCALEYMKDNYHEKLYIKDVAKKVLMSESYFSYFFKKVTGKTFVEYLNFIRIENAKALLRNSDMAIAQIGYAVGFNEIPYFTTVFKKETNYTPAKYRNVFNENISD